MDSWSDHKAALKKEICNYFFSQGAGKPVVAKACEFVKTWGEIFVEIGDSSPATAEDDYIVDNFSPAHREKVAEWINRYAVLYQEAVDHLEAQRNYGQKTRWGRDDFELEDWESTQPDGEIQVHGRCIKVFAFGYKEGFAQSLPKQGKKSVGKTMDGGYEWEYPLSQLDNLKSVGLPVLYAIDSTVKI